ncbi:MAG: malto-oligosyltrehalose synthase, partial [Acidimicrobiia bacterium]
MLARAARRAGSAPLARLAEAFGSLPHAALADPRSIQRRHDRTLALAAELAGLCEQDGIAEAVDDELARVAGDPDRLDDLLRRQNFRLAHWRTASEELDHRRFFNIASLVGVRVEDGDVFDATHGLVLELVADGTVSGLRIDHIDGLRDPSSYLDRLARATGGTYTVVEKILLGDERLPDRWPVAGTSGYDFLVRVNDLFVAVENERAMTDLYAELTGEPATFDEVVHESKHQIMREELRAEVEQVTGLLAAVADGERRHRDHTRRELRDALREVVAAFTVYRTYVEPGRPPGAEDRRRIDEAVEAAGRRRPDVDPELLALIGAVARGEQAGGDADELCQRLQQLTAPVTAKGVEDTAFYRYNRLVSLNEVGGDPGRFGREPAEFHRLTAATARRWPETMLTLATHDTKRSADVRARIDVLAELVDEWAGAVHRWSEQDERHRHDGWPERNVAYLLYQTLVGAWPLEPDRAVAYLLKAVREAKVHTSWSDPVAGYEDAVSAFVRSLLGDESFVTDLEAFLAQHDVVGRGRRKALAQTALLLTCPGVPDLYQGSELWDSSLVDPDNRRPVDFDLRRQTLADARGLDAGAALRRIDEGIPKQWMISRLLAHRRREPATYRSSTYEPLAVTGARPDGILAFSRGDLVVVVPVRDGVGPDLAVDLPQGRWLDVLGGASHDGGRRRADALLADFPVAVLGRAR